MVILENNYKLNDTKINCFSIIKGEYNRIIIGTKDFYIKIFDFNYKLKKVLNIHNEEINEILIYKNYLISDSKDNTIQFIYFSKLNNEINFELKYILNKEVDFKNIKLYKDYLVSYSDYSLKIYNLEDIEDKNLEKNYLNKDDINVNKLIIYNDLLIIGFNKISFYVINIKESKLELVNEIDKDINCVSCMITCNDFLIVGILKKVIFFDFNDNFKKVSSFNHFDSSIAKLNTHKDYLLVLTKKNNLKLFKIGKYFEFIKEIKGLDNITEIKNSGNLFFFISNQNFGIFNLMKNIEDKNNDYDENKDKLAYYINENYEIKNEIVDVKKELEQIYFKNKQLSKKLKNYEQNNVNHKIQDLHELNISKIEIKNESSDYYELKNKYDDLAKLNKTLNTTNNNLNKLINEDLKKKIENLTNNNLINEDLNKKNKNLKKEYEILKKENLEWKNNRNFNNSNSENNLQIKKLESKIKNLNNKFNEAITKNNMLLILNHKLEEKCQKYNSNYNLNKKKIIDKYLNDMMNSQVNLYNSLKKKSKIKENNIENSKNLSETNELKNNILYKDTNNDSCLINVSVYKIDTNNNNEIKNDLNISNSINSNSNEFNKIDNLEENKLKNSNLNIIKDINIKNKSLNIEQIKEIDNNLNNIESKIESDFKEVINTKDNINFTVVDSKLESIVINNFVKKNKSILDNNNNILLENSKIKDNKNNSEGEGNSQNSKNNKVNSQNSSEYDGNSKNSKKSKSNSKNSKENKDNSQKSKIIEDNNQNSKNIKNNSKDDLLSF